MKNRMIRTTDEMAHRFNPDPTEAERLDAIAAAKHPSTCICHGCEAARMAFEDGIACGCDACQR